VKIVKLVLNLVQIVKMVSDLVKTVKMDLEQGLMISVVLVSLLDLGWNLADCSQLQEEEKGDHYQQLEILEQLLRKEQLGEQLLVVSVA